MSFFSKLKDRMLRSSSKLDEGLDALVTADRGADDAAGPAATTPPAPDQTPDQTPDLTPAPAATQTQPGAPDPSAPSMTAQPRKGLIARLTGRDDAPRRVLDDDMIEELEDLLVQADLGVDTALKVTANIAAARFGKRVTTDEIKAALAEEIARIMDPVARPMPLYAKRPQVVLVVGVNGAGKTTTIGKLASQFRAAGKSVIIAAGDTFRAAAVEQLQVWGERAGVPVMTAPGGAIAEPGRSDGGTRQDRACDPQERRHRSAQHAAGSGCNDGSECAQPGRRVPPDGRCDRSGHDQA